MALPFTTSRRTGTSVPTLSERPAFCQRFPRGKLWRQILTVLIATLCAIFAPQNSGAQDPDFPDKVVLAPGGRVSTKSTVNCEILEYNGDLIRIRTKLGEEPKEYRAADVIEVLTHQVELHIKGLELFQQKDYSGAAKSLRSAMETEPRMWVRREILVSLIRCHLMQGDYRNAAAKFAILLRSDPSTRSFPLIPLIWHRIRIDPSFRSDALKWMQDEDELPALRLLGASVLLDDPQLGAQAIATLKNLGANRDRRIGVLAGCQLWRTRLDSRTEINLTELKSWTQRADTLPEGLRFGPHFLLGKAYATRKEFELAAVHFLWQPLTQPDDHFLAAQAMLNAADALAAISQLSSAIQLYEEVMDRFANTPAAQEAAGQVKSLAPSS